MKLAESCGPSTKYWSKGVVLMRQIKTLHHITLIHSICIFCSHCPYMPFTFFHRLHIPSVCLFPGIDIHVPSFMGQSYMQYIGLRRTVLSFAVIEITFKPEDPNGMLLYNGYTTDRSGDFISLSLIDGYLEYRFDLGTGPAVIRWVVDTANWKN